MSGRALMRINNTDYKDVKRKKISYTNGEASKQ